MNQEPNFAFEADAGGSGAMFSVRARRGSTLR